MGAELFLTIAGLYMLIKGQSFGKTPVHGPGVRWLGAFCVTVLPVGLVVVFLFTAVWLARHPDVTGDEVPESIRWPAIGVEGGVVAAYVLVATLWERAIRKRSALTTAADPQGLAPATSRTG